VKKLALFDLDGTITTKDSFIDFMIYAVGYPRFISGGLVLLPGVIRYFLKKIKNDKFKEMVLTQYYKGWETEKFENLAQDYSRNQLPKIMKKVALDRISWHQKEGHRVVIVSASMRRWLKPWCDDHGLELISTELESRDGKITGKLSTPNCYGPEKVIRIKAFLNLDEYEFVYAYGDSSGDKEMLALAVEPYFRHFK